MTLCDAGPLVALVNHTDPHHARCATALKGMGTPLLLSTWPCLAEAMYLIGKLYGARGCAC